MDNQASSLKHWIVVGLFVVFAIILFGMLWLFLFAPSNPTGFGWYLFSFAAGLTMIVLPCTLPLAFVIVPLSMGKGITKGLGIALAFGIGVAITLSLYGVAAAIVGQFAIGSLGAPLEVVKNWVYLIAGIFAYLFALGEVGLIKFRMPTYSGAAPAFIQKRKDIMKALFLGLFLGNIGVGCPHPATPLILVEIATSGNIFYGWSLFFIHAIGRVLPLLFLAVLGVLGVNGLSWLVTRKDKVERATGWAMVFVGAFILVLGLFTHDWWVNSGIHTQLEKITQEERLLDIVRENLNSDVTHAHGLEDGPGLFGLPLTLGNWVLVFLWILPIWWWYARRRKEMKSIPGTNMVPEKLSVSKNLSVKKYLFISLTLLLGFIFIYALPHNFIYHESQAQDHAHDSETADDHGHSMDEMMEHMHEDGTMHDHMEEMMEHDEHAGHEAQFHEESDVTSGIVVNFIPPSEEIIAGKSTKLKFFVNMLPGSFPITDLDLNHEKYIHVIGLRDDMNQFFHIHPHYAGPGLWEVEHTFAEPGTYKTWTDVTHRGVVHSFGHSTFTVKAETPQVKPTSRYIEFFKNVVVGNYQVAISHPEPIVMGRDTHIDFTIRDVLSNGVVLENYLGVPMHLAVIKDDLSTYLHTHPDDHSEESEDGHDHSQNIFGTKAFAHGSEIAVEGTHLGFTVNFPTAGVYKMFAQFRPAEIDLPPDEAVLAEFYVKVFETGPAYPETEGDGHDDHDHGASEPVSRVLLTIVSLVLIAVLGFGVYKFVNVKQ